jgi:hypothetical protein
LARNVCRESFLSLGGEGQVAGVGAKRRACGAASSAGRELIGATSSLRRGFRLEWLGCPPPGKAVQASAGRIPGCR